MAIDFLICNYNGGDLLRSAVQSILALELDEFNVYIYDNASSDSSIKLIEELNSNKIHIVHGETNIGYGKAINHIYKISKSQYIFILNPDSELVFSGNELLQLASNTSDRNVYGFDIYNNDNTPQNFITSEPSYSWVVGGLLRTSFPIIFELLYKQYFFFHNKRQESEIENNKGGRFVSGCALLFTRNGFQKLGLFNEQYFLYFEDTELLLTAWKNDFIISQSPLKVIHNASYSFRKADNKIKVEKYRSALIYFRNNRGLVYYSWVKFLIIFIAFLALINPLNIFYRKTSDYYINLIKISINN
ncbi:glycosyltransferase family 2 protein [Sediminibacterium sp. KACHI17]|uniref:Glycosyltransferase family 2 protein n=1 Tax=Sediminibacterium sp. KACHI17 TaxID=1751071 RepID=A0AAT9GI68_9BACT